MGIEINIKNHTIKDEKVIEIVENNQLIATIIPRSNEIVVISKYIESILDTKYPQKASIVLKRDIFDKKGSFLNDIDEQIAHLEDVLKKMKKKKKDNNSKGGDKNGKNERFKE